MQAIYATGKKFEVGTEKPASYELDAIRGLKPSVKAFDVGDRLVFKDNAVRLERTLRDGTKRYFDLRGKTLR